MRSSRSLGTYYLAWMGIILLGIVSSAAIFPDSFIIDATNEKYNLLHSRRLESTSSNPPLSIEQFDLCLSDLKLADANANSQLDKSEYLLFLSLNSANYGYAWGDAAKQFTLSALPLELVMLFHSTACICAYDEQDSTSTDFGCCMGSNEHVIVYDVTGNNKTEAQVAYTRLFCSEAYYSYSVTVIPTENPVASPTTQSPTVSTFLPTEIDQGTTSPTLTMISPVMPSTLSPTQEGSEKVTSPTTTGTMSPTLISMPTALTPSPVPDTPTTSLNPNTIITTSPASSSELPTSSSPNTLSINIEYGISSDCGMTAEDVMNDNYGITIKDGLITATEVVLVDILNITYPREAQSMTDAPSPTMPPAADSESNPFLPPAVDDLDSMSMPETTVESDPFMPPNAEDESTNTKSLKTLNNVRIRVDGEKLGLQDEDDPSSRRRGLVLIYETYSQQMKQEKGLRSLVYYTNLNPITITDVEDVVDDNCPDGVVCMKVKSTIFVPLEEGDVAAEVEAVIQDGFQKSLEDASFFSSMPSETIVCPSTTTVPTSESTSLPIPLSPSPIAITLVTMQPSSIAETGSPALDSVPPSSTPPIVTTIPTSLSMDLSISMPDLRTDSPTFFLSAPSPITSETPSAASEVSFTGPTNVTIQYSFNNDCGLDAEAIMNEEGNIFKDVLIDVTTAATIKILNETFPRLEDGAVVGRRGVRTRTRRLVHLDNQMSKSFISGNQHRNLVYYTDEYPITIDRILDVESCDPGFNCLLVISAISVILEAGDDPVQVSEAIVRGITESFKDGSIYNTVPQASLECPAAV